VVIASRATRPRRTFSRIESAVAVHTNGVGFVLFAWKVRVDRGDQVGHGMEHATAQGFVGELPEEPLDEVQPRPRRRREMQMKPGMLGEPRVDIVVFVGCVVVEVVTRVLPRGRGSRVV
jgi:hypothetical protein